MPNLDRVIVFFLLFCFSLIDSISANCKTKRGKTCQFPFIYLGVTYNECTTVDFGAKSWCATSVTSTKEVNDYDECSSSCPVATITTPSGGCLTTTGSFCKFPFKYQGTTYTTCTNIGFGNTMWCATALTLSGETKGYGICSSDCPQTSTLSPDECGTLSGNRCVFPFVYSNMIYNSCTIADNDGTPWCATSVDPSTKVVNNYGQCRSTCSVDVTPTSRPLGLTEKPPCVNAKGAFVGLGKGSNSNKGR